MNLINIEFEKKLKYLENKINNIETKMKNTIYWYAKEKKGIEPYKKREEDVGYDLHIVKKISTNGDLTMYDTCIQLKPPEGYYIQIHARSSLCLKGYILANSVGVIDPGYTGTIKIPLIKINKYAEDLELPSRVVQAILVKHHTSNISNYNFSEFNDSDRGENGFGSSG